MNWSGLRFPQPKSNGASTWSSHVITSITSHDHHTWPLCLRGWHDATKPLPPFLSLPLGFRRLLPSSRLLTDQTPAEVVVVDCHLSVGELLCRAWPSSLHGICWPTRSYENPRRRRVVAGGTASWTQQGSASLV